MRRGSSGRSQLRPRVARLPSRSPHPYEPLGLHVACVARGAPRDLQGPCKARQPVGPLGTPALGAWAWHRRCPESSHVWTESWCGVWGEGERQGFRETETERRERERPAAPVPAAWSPCPGTHPVRDSSPAPTSPQPAAVPGAAGREPCTAGSADDPSDCCRPVSPCAEGHLVPCTSD